MVEKSTEHLKRLITQIHILSKELYQKIDEIRESSVTLGARPRNLSDLPKASKHILQAQLILKNIHRLRTDLNLYRLAWSKTHIASLNRDSPETKWTITVSLLNQEISERTTIIQKNLIHSYELLDHYSEQSIQQQLAAGTTQDQINSSWQTNRDILTELLRVAKIKSSELQDKIKTTLMFLP